jgi:hypothetical protein
MLFNDFDLMMLKINKKKLKKKNILMHFQAKNTLHHNTKYLACRIT